MTTFLLIRHATNDFTGKRLVGRLPGVHLNADGIQQAEQLAQALKDLPLQAIYSSPLERAVETAQPLADLKGLPVHIRPGMVEVDFGTWVGKTFPQMRRTRLWKTIRSQPSQAQFPGGESFVSAQERICADLEEIHTRHAEDDTVAVFAHADVIRIATAHYLGLNLDNFQRLAQEPASITTLILKKDAPPHLGMMNYVIGREFIAPVDKQKRRKSKKPDQKTSPGS